MTAPKCETCGDAYDLYAPAYPGTLSDREVWKHWCPRHGREFFLHGDGSMTKERSYAEAGVDLEAERGRWRGER